jgi:hypothetical protein
MYESTAHGGPSTRRGECWGWRLHVWCFHKSEAPPGPIQKSEALLSNIVYTQYPTPPVLSRPSYTARSPQHGLLRGMSGSLAQAKVGNCKGKWRAFCGKLLGVFSLHRACRAQSCMGFPDRSQYEDYNHRSPKLKPGGRNGTGAFETPVFSASKQCSPNLLQLYGCSRPRF